MFMLGSMSCVSVNRNSSVPRKYLTDRSTFKHVLSTLCIKLSAQLCFDAFLALFVCIPSSVLMHSYLCFDAFLALS